MCQKTMEALGRMEKNRNFASTQQYIYQISADMRNEIKEYEAVAKAAENFVKSVAEGNSSYARQLFTQDAVLFGILDGV